VLAKLLVLNDPHTSDNAPKWRKDSYNDDIFAKLECSVKLASDYNVDAIILTGDLFHIPTPSKVSHTLVNRWMKLFDQFSKWFIVVGNHDLTGSLDQLYRQPIGVFSTHPNVDIFEEGGVYCVGGIFIAGVHWHYNLTSDTIKNKTPSDIDALFLHAALALKSNPFFETIGWEELDGVASVICHGHMHIPTPIQKLKYSWFVNPGSLTRRCLGSYQGDDDDQNRIPQVALIEIDSKNVNILISELE